MIKVLGFIDFLASVLIISSAFNILIPQKILTFFAVYLIIKGLIFFKFIASWIDLLAGIAIVLIIFNLAFSWLNIAEVILGFLLLQKAFLSMIG